MSEKDISKNKSDQNRLELEWIEKIKNDDKLAYEKLFRKYYKILLEFAWDYVKDIQVAENIVQEVFFRIWVNRKKISISSRVNSYLLTSVKNQSLKYIRHQKVEKRTEIELDSIDCSLQTPEDVLNEKDIVIAVRAAINELPDRCREIFILSRYKNYKYSEIADLLKISISTVETQMGRAYKFLREHLSDLLTLISI